MIFHEKILLMMFFDSIVWLESMNTSQKTILWEVHMEFLRKKCPKQEKTSQKGQKKLFWAEIFFRVKKWPRVRISTIVSFFRYSLAIKGLVKGFQWAYKI